MEAQKLRDLMRQEKASRNRPPPKLAVWKEGGQLQCQVCKAVVNSEGLWNAHLRSPQHLRILEALRRKLEESKKAESVDATSEPCDKSIVEETSKLIVEETSKSIVEETSKAIVEEIPKAVELTSAVDKIEPISAAHSSTVVVREAQGPCLPSKSASSTAPVESAPKRRCFAGPLPLEAFDVEQVTLAEVHEEKEETGQEEEVVVVYEAHQGLPSGFFDTERDEAKSRGIKEKNLEKRKKEKMEMEMRRFETLMEKEEQRMEAVRSDLDEMAFSLRNEEERDLMKEYEEKVEHYRNKIDLCKDDQPEKEESSESGSDIDIDAIQLDWRSKSIFGKS